MIGPTARQSQVLEFIEKFQAENGYSPSLREIGKHIGVRSLRGVTVHLDALQKKGLITRSACPRSISVVKRRREASRGLEMPILKREDWDILHQGLICLENSLRDTVHWSDDLDQRVERLLWICLEKICESPE